MTTGEGSNVAGGGPADRADGRDTERGRGERIGIGGGDDSVTRIQLAARWSEAYAPPHDSLAAVLKRFRAAYEYLDAVTHGVEPPDVERDQPELAHTMPTPAAQPGAPPPQSPPEPLVRCGDCPLCRTPRRFAWSPPTPRPPPPIFGGGGVKGGAEV